MKHVARLVTLIALPFLVMSCAEDTGSPVDPPNKNTATSESGGVTAEEAAKTALSVGDQMPAFELPDSRNRMITSAHLLKDKNLVVVFYRGGWCPYCNTYLKKFQDKLPEIEAAGGELVAISAENPDDSLSTEEKNRLKFHVLSDKRLAYSRKFGLVFELAAETNRRYKENGIDLIVDNDMDRPELPISATYVINRSGKIVFAFVEPDYKQRAEPETVIARLKELKPVA